MPLTWDEYKQLKSFGVLYSGGLDSAAVAILMGEIIPGDVHLLTFRHDYGAMFNEWSRRHNDDLRGLLGDRVYHHLVLLAHVARAVVVVAGVVEIVAPREVVGVFVGVFASAVPFVRPVSIRGVRVVRVETREVVRVLP